MFAFFGSADRFPHPLQVGFEVFKAQHTARLGIPAGTQDPEAEADKPQQKKAKDHQIYLSNLKKGDNVVTSGGLHGQITGLTETVVTLEIAENLRVKVSRQHILGSKASVTADNEAAATGTSSGGST